MPSKSSIPGALKSPVLTIPDQFIYIQKNYSLKKDIKNKLTDLRILFIYQAPGGY